MASTPSPASGHMTAAVGTPGVRCWNRCYDAIPPTGSSPSVDSSAWHRVEAPISINTAISKNITLCRKFVTIRHKRRTGENRD